MTKRFWIAAFLLAGLTALLWGVNWWANRSLFMDEANVARNLFELSYGELLTGPLRYQQYAPPFYLVVTKALAEGLGYSERALRLPALCSGLLAFGWLLLAGRQRLGAWWALLPLALLAVNPTALRYVGEVKPYATDLAVSAAILWVGLRKRPLAPGWLALGGAVAVWVSLPAIFGLAGLGLSNFLCSPRPRPKTKSWWTPERKRWSGVGAAWLLSFAVLYVLVLRPSLSDAYLRGYHERYFLPLPGREFSVGRFFGLLHTLIKTAFGFTAVASVMGVVFSGLGLWVAPPRLRWLLGTPLLLVLAASALGKYSLLPRLLLFTLPFFWFLAAVGTRWAYRRLRQGWMQAGLLLLWLIVLGGTNVVRHYWSPLRFSDGRKLAEAVASARDVTPLVHPSAQPVWAYYHAIHPDPVILTEAIKFEAYGDIPLATDYLIAYDVLTSAHTQQQVQRDSIRATERRCRAEWTQMFRSGVLFVECGDWYRNEF